MFLQRPVWPVHGHAVLVGHLSNQAPVQAVPQPRSPVPVPCAPSLLGAGGYCAWLRFVNGTESNARWAACAQHSVHDLQTKLLVG